MLIHLNISQFIIFHTAYLLWVSGKLLTSNTRQGRPRTRRQSIRWQVVPQTLPTKSEVHNCLVRVHSIQTCFAKVGMGELQCPALNTTKHLWDQLKHQPDQPQTDFTNAPVAGMGKSPQLHPKIS